MDPIHAELISPSAGQALQKDHPNLPADVRVQGTITFVDHTRRLGKPPVLDPGHKGPSPKLPRPPQINVPKGPLLVGDGVDVTDIRVRLGHGAELAVESTRRSATGPDGTIVTITWHLDHAISGATDFGPVDLVVSWTATETHWSRPAEAPTVERQSRTFNATIVSSAPTILAKWQSLGGAGGPLGASIGALKRCEVQGREVWAQSFEHGAIVDLGNGTVSAGLGNGGSGGGASLPETPYRLTLEGIRCDKGTAGEIGTDEVWTRLVFATAPSAGTPGARLYVADARYQDMGPGRSIQGIGQVIYEGPLPELFSFQMLSIEVNFQPDADEVMLDFVAKLQDEAGLWFTPGQDSTETQLTFNLWANRIVGGVLVAMGDFWTKVITAVMEPTMEAILTALQGWYKSRLLGVTAFPPLGEFVRQLAAGQYPPEESPQAVQVYGNPPDPSHPLLMKVRYLAGPDGAVLEERKFVGGTSDADYTFTFKHWLGAGPGSAPTRAIALSIDSTYMNLFNPNQNRSYFSRSENKLTFTTDVKNEFGYHLERSLNGAPFVGIAQLKCPAGVQKLTYTDIQLPEEEVCRYRVRAYNASGFGPYSSEVESALPVPVSPPYGFSSSTTYQGGGMVKVHVFWMDQCTDNRGYMLERARSNQPFVQIADVSAFTPSTRGGNFPDVLSDAASGEKIRYRARSYNEYGRGTYSAEFIVTL